MDGNVMPHLLAPRSNQMPEIPTRFAHEFQENVAHTIQAAEHCLRERQYIPALVLMYSLMDSLAWTASDPKRGLGVRRRFEAWVGHWLLPNLQLTCSELAAVDLYAARCAVLHSMTNDSELSRRGKAKRIVYARDASDLGELKVLIEDHPRAIYVPLPYGALLSSLTRSASAFIKEAANSALLSERVLEASKRHKLTLTRGGAGS